ncbi:glycoside hydrolase family 130 protein [Synechococcus sp. CS-1324]|uniref:glycoside hydrolase family 130 protein n=1 Tax=Synechococcus sp. CS-1324 TaxID=2847980 RepID=UPI000DB2184C|nr:glycoside hydrolase family 130 protein [Synechococcus sp. CS-1324]MCT0229604.1 glycoside hydrolase family 130 protein [Synechococcus sp. CS-1324]PZV02860.1 MAG: glycosidase [Cyanobium sp.]
MTVQVNRTSIQIRPDPSRVFFRPFEWSNRERVQRIVARVTSLSRSDAEHEAALMLERFEGRHEKLQTFLLSRFDHAREYLISDQPLNHCERLLIGAYFTLEYSLEAAALFNPSIVPHPDQSGLEEGSLRFLLSLRATGEGHISSIVFRTGVINRQLDIVLDVPSPFVAAADVHPNPSYDKYLFERKLLELGLLSPFAQRLMDQLQDHFSFEQLTVLTNQALRRDRFGTGDSLQVAESVLSLARANYEISFDTGDDCSERVIFPTSPTERRGIEDARFVAFCDDDGQTTYYATYSAYDGQLVFPQLLETKDFSRFKISTLNGPEVENKGMALFPRKVRGHYAMLSRQDGENIYLMYSDQLNFWYEKSILMRPTYPWEFVQIGNCGSPIETEAGWLVLTHGVGPMRRYTIGAILLDLEDPGRVIGRLTEPLLEPTQEEREGYVPNVVYSCGSLIHAGKLILPYAMSDQSTSFATLSVEELLGALKATRMEDNP